ncbi:hypothetical protein N7481_003182 [Penicillium waksmanii]|uniref:uncharacterized protein n=1 Tax=Penicillium waksmanii TaxID=69791 RepID=UPI0025489C95|nr:uncharacterized protein N7481_003182 [Penicillium waksmanii]KAJ5987972.1 hypothetical protein N7481_003182 [Penicillium waksmanii]
MVKIASRSMWGFRRLLKTECDWALPSLYPGLHIQFHVQFHKSIQFFSRTLDIGLDIRFPSLVVLRPGKKLGFDIAVVPFICRSSLAKSSAPILLTSDSSADALAKNSTSISLSSHSSPAALANSSVSTSLSSHSSSATLARKSASISVSSHSSWPQEATSGQGLYSISPRRATSLGGNEEEPIFNSHEEREDGLRTGGGRREGADKREPTRPHKQVQSRQE